jgi:hypothetical protein
MKRFAAPLGFCALAFALAGCSSASTTGTPPPPTQISTAQSGIGQGATPTPTGSPTSPALTSAPPASTSAAASDVGVCVTPVVTCRGELKTEPSEIIVSGDGTAFITGLVWTGWGLSSATGAGTLKLDNCNPDCAQGSLKPYRVTVVVSKLTPYVGGAAYATMVVAAPGSPYGTKTFRSLAP